MSSGPDAYGGIEVDKCVKDDRTWVKYSSNKPPVMLGKCISNEYLKVVEFEKAKLDSNRYVIYPYNESGNHKIYSDLMNNEMENKKIKWHYYSDNGKRIELGNFVGRTPRASQLQSDGKWIEGDTYLSNPEFENKTKLIEDNFFIYPESEYEKENMPKLSYHSEKINTMISKISEILSAINLTSKELTSDVIKNIDILSDNINILHSHLGSSEQYITRCHSVSNSARAESAKARVAEAAKLTSATATHLLGRVSGFLGRGGRSRKNQRKSRRAKTNRVARTRRQNKFSRM
jgi:hypothetical protein